MANWFEIQNMTQENFSYWSALTSKYIKSDVRNRDRQPISNTCIDLDRDIKLIRDDIVKGQSTEPDNQTRVLFLTHAQEMLEQKFNRFDCVNKIEDTRFDESGNLITQGSIRQEQTVLGKSNLESNIYILVGGVVFITALLIVLKSKK